jgi:hypothetical protein
MRYSSGLLLAALLAAAPLGAAQATTVAAGGVLDFSVNVEAAGLDLLTGYVVEFGSSDPLQPGESYKLSFGSTLGGEELLNLVYSPLGSSVFGVSAVIGNSTVPGAPLTGYTTLFARFSAFGGSVDVTRLRLNFASEDLEASSRLQMTEVSDAPAVPLPAGLPLALTALAAFGALDASRRLRA